MATPLPRTIALLLSALPFSGAFADPGETWMDLIEPQNAQSMGEWRSLRESTDWQPCKNGDLCIGETSITQILIVTGKANPAPNAPAYVASAPGGDATIQGQDPTPRLALRLDGRVYAPIESVGYNPEYQFIQVEGPAATACQQSGDAIERPESAIFAVVNNRIVRIYAGEGVGVYTDFILTLNSRPGNFVCNGRIDLRARAFGPNQVPLNTQGSWEIKIESFSDNPIMGSVEITIPPALHLDEVPENCTLTSNLSCAINDLEPSATLSITILASALETGHGNLTCAVHVGTASVFDVGCGVAVETFIPDSVFSNRFQ